MTHRFLGLLCQTNLSLLAVDAQRCSIPACRFHPGHQQGEHPEDHQPHGRGPEHPGSDQQAVRDPQLPPPGSAECRQTAGLLRSAGVYWRLISCVLPPQSLDEVIKDLMASVHRELSDKQSLAFSMTFLPTKLEFTTASAESSFVFEFASPDARSNFEQAFEEAKKKLGESSLDIDVPSLVALSHCFLKMLSYFERVDNNMNLFSPCGRLQL